VTDGLSFPTSLGTSTADQIRLLGQDLTADLMGQVSFGELAFWLVTLRRPTPSETRVFEAVLVALADHGFTPTAIAARLTYLSAPARSAASPHQRLCAGHSSRGLGMRACISNQLCQHRPHWDTLCMGCRRSVRRN
jgi:citrate synthase